MLALSHDVVEGMHRLVERRVGIRPMHQVRVDVVGLQPPQTLLDGRQNPPAAAVAPVWHFLVADAEFGDDGDIMTMAAERPRQGLFRYPRAVGFGRIEAGYAIFDRLPNGAAELALVDPAISAADLPAAEADRRYLEVGLAE